MRWVKILHFCIISVYVYDNLCLHAACPGLFNMSSAHDDFNGLQNISDAYCLFLVVAYSRTIYIFIRILWNVSNKGVLIVSLMKGH